MSTRTNPRVESRPPGVGAAALAAVKVDQRGDVLDAGERIVLETPGDRPVLGVHRGSAVTANGS